MSSIGNDIISLHLINIERTLQERFYSKIVCKEEVELYNDKYSGKLSFVNFVWLSWSVKESVFKFYKRIYPELLFSPTKIAIRNIQLPLTENILHFNSIYEAVSLNPEEGYCCETRFNAISFYTRSIINDELVYTVAGGSNNFNNIHWGIKKINSDNYAVQSQSVRKLALARLKYFLQEDVSIEKTAAGYPVVAQRNEIPISFTHHGKLIGYAFKLEAEPTLL